MNSSFIEEQYLAEVVDNIINTLGFDQEALYGEDIRLNFMNGNYVDIYEPEIYSGEDFVYAISNIVEDKFDYIDSKFNGEENAVEMLDNDTSKRIIEYGFYTKIPQNNGLYFKVINFFNFRKITWSNGSERLIEIDVSDNVCKCCVKKFIDSFVI